MSNFEATEQDSARLRHRWAQSRQLLVITAFCAIAAGCQKTETIPTTEERLKAVQQKQETQPDFYVPRKSVDYMSDMKAIKEAAARPEPSKSAPAPVPAKTETRVAAAPVAPPPAPAASTPTRVAEPPVQVASAAPTARPAPEDPTMVKVLTREQPEFPREAMQQGVESATILARMTINAAGNVTAVTILQAKPARLFDRSVKTSLARWKFNPGADGRSYETEISFKLQ
ncbi:MAG TPA: TonB family protein [Usitatibacteraceae bacterium]